MPTLYKIATKLQEYVLKSTTKFDKIYITGTMSAVNNIDLYFQEFFKTEKCELLKPYFVTENIKINIKDYIEVNSAIALALQGLGYGLKNMNFKKATLMEQLPDWLKLDMSLGKKDNKKEHKKININFNLSGKLDATERWLLRGAAGILILTVIYSGFSVYLNNKISEKIAEAEEVSSYTDTQIAAVTNDINEVRNKTTQYQQMKDNLTSINERLQEDLSFRGAIPNLMMEIMTTIPRNVQITQIQNTTDRHIVINAQSKYYDDLGYFKAVIKEDGILNNVVSTQGEKQGDFVKIVIEGDLP